MCNYVLSGLTANTLLLSHLANPHLYINEAGTLIDLKLTMWTWMIRQRAYPRYLLISGSPT